MYKILIVEDDLLMAQAIQQEMTMWGHEAEYVKDFRNVLQDGYYASVFQWIPLVQ